MGYFPAMHRVVALVRPVQSTFELGCAAEVFGTPRAGLPQYYEFEVCTETPGPVPTSAGYAMSVTRGLSAIESADTVIIPGWLPVEAPLSGPVRDALLRAHARGTRLVTICSGVFALARTGLLDGRSATTHWGRAEQLRREFPQVRVELDVPWPDASPTDSARAPARGCSPAASPRHAPCWRRPTCRWRRSRRASASPRRSTSAAAFTPR